MLAQAMILPSPLKSASRIEDWRLGLPMVPRSSPVAESHTRRVPLHVVRRREPSRLNSTSNIHVSSRFAASLKTMPVCCIGFPTGAAGFNVPNLRHTGVRRRRNASAIGAKTNLRPHFALSEEAHLLQLRALGK